MAHCTTIVLTDAEAAIFAAIRVFLITLAGPLLWGELLCGPCADVCASEKREVGR